MLLMIGIVDNSCDAIQPEQQVIWKGEFIIEFGYSLPYCISCQIMSMCSKKQRSVVDIEMHLLLMHGTSSLS